MKITGYGCGVTGAGVGSGGYGSVVSTGPGVGGTEVGSGVAGGTAVGGTVVGATAVTVGVGVGVAGGTSVARGGRDGVTSIIPGVRVGVNVGAGEPDFLQAVGKSSKSRDSSRIACQNPFLE